MFRTCIAEEMEAAEAELSGEAKSLKAEDAAGDKQQEVLEKKVNAEHGAVDITPTQDKELH